MANKEQLAKELMENEEFQRLLGESGAETNEAEIARLLEEYPEQELTEDDLDEVAGGIGPTLFRRLPPRILKWLLEKLGLKIKKEAKK